MPSIEAANLIHELGPGSSAPMHPFLETTTELFDQVMAGDVRGSFWQSSACVRDGAVRTCGRLVLPAVQLARRPAEAAVAEIDSSSYSCRNAVTTGSLAARIAGSRPPTRPMSTA